MFDNDDEIRLEQLISYEGISKEKRDLCVNLLIHTKEMCDSELCVFNNNSSFKLANLYLERSGNEILFNGSALNDSETRLLDGMIYVYKNQYVVANNIYRISPFLKDDNKFLCCADTFKFCDDKIIRSTMYENCPIPFVKKELDEFDYDFLYDYYSMMINPDKNNFQLKKDTNY